EPTTLRLGALRAAAAVAGLSGGVLRGADGPGLRAGVPRRRRELESGVLAGDVHRRPVPRGVGHDPDPDRDHHPGPVRPRPGDGPGPQRQTALAGSLAVSLRDPARGQRVGGRDPLVRGLHAAGVAEQHPRRSWPARSAVHLPRLREPGVADPDHRPRRSLARDLDHHDHPGRRVAGHPARLRRGRRRLRRHVRPKGAAGDPAPAPPQHPGRPDPAHDLGLPGVRGGDRAGRPGDDGAFGRSLPVVQRLPRSPRRRRLRRVHPAALRVQHRALSLAAAGAPGAGDV
ncbi:MAG: hypothetical protein AVDCRST_MAG73-1952, partial [uncultured Thermomicrobiales bacterium]